MLNKTSDQQKENELMMLLDYNEDRSLQTSSTTRSASESSKESLNFDKAFSSIQDVSAKVHINTLSPYIGFGGGVYKMTVVKRITATKDFLQMPLEDRKCDIESYEDCRSEMLRNKCKCVPWEVPGFQVKAQ